MALLMELEHLLCIVGIAVKHADDRCKSDQYIVEE